MGKEKVVEELLKKGVRIDVIQDLINLNKDTILQIKATMRVRKNRTLDELTTNDIETIYRMYQDNVSIVNISKALRLHRSTTTAILDQKFPNRKRKILSEVEKEIVYRMYEEEDDVAKIAKLLMISKQYATEIIKKKGIYRYKNKQAGKRLTNKQIETILSLHTQGLNTIEIAKQVGVNQSTVMRWIQKKKAL